MDCGFVRAQPHIVPSTDKVVPVDEHALRSHEQLPLLIYHLMMLLCVDLDGVLYRGSEPIPGVGSLLTERVAAGDRVAYITNNSFLRRDEYRARIESCGAPFSDAALFTAVDLTAARFRAAGAQKILVYGAAGLVDELRAADLDARATTELGDEAALAAWGADGVCVGLHRHATQRELALATAALRAGARFITPNRDAAYPDPGELTPGTGAAVAALEAASGVRAEVVGKPAPDLILAAADAANAARVDLRALSSESSSSTSARRGGAASAAAAAAPGPARAAPPAAAAPDPTPRGWRSRRTAGPHWPRRPSAAPGCSWSPGDAGTCPRSWHPRRSPGPSAAHGGAAGGCAPAAPPAADGPAAAPARRCPPPGP